MARRSSSVCDLQPDIALGRIAHLHGGVGMPVGSDDAYAESFWRVAVGKTIVERRWYRAWSRWLSSSARGRSRRERACFWDAVPQVQVSLSKRQHVLLNVGIRVPVNPQEGRRGTMMTYLLGTGRRRVLSAGGNNARGDCCCGGRLVCVSHGECRTERRPGAGRE